MKFFFFHLMPYAALDPDLRQEIQLRLGHAAEHLLRSEERPRSSTTAISTNSTIADALRLRRRLRQRASPERLWPDADPRRDGGRAGAPHQERKIAVLGRALPLLNNPLTVAEEFAMLDNITGGRLVAGFVRGIGAEYHSWGANPAESHERFHEAHDLILQAWTQPGPFACSRASIITSNT